MTGSKREQTNKRSGKNPANDLQQQNLERLKFEVGQEMGIHTKQKNKKY